MTIISWWMAGYLHIFLPQLSTMVNDSYQLVDGGLFAHIFTSAIHSGE